MITLSCALLAGSLQAAPEADRPCGRTPCDPHHRVRERRPL